MEKSQKSYKPLSLRRKKVANNNGPGARVPVPHGPINNQIGDDTDEPSLSSEDDVEV